MISDQLEMVPMVLRTRIIVRDHLTLEETGSSKPSGSYDKSKNKFASGDKPKHQVSKESKLTEKQKADYMAKGRCFGCGEKGHIAPRCPLNQSVKSSGSSSKPPGVKSFSVKVAADREKTLQALSSTTEEPNTIGSAVVHFEEFSRIEEVDEDDYCMSVELNYVGLEDEESSSDDLESNDSETLTPEPVSLQDFEDLARDYYDPEAIPWADQELGSPVIQQVEYLLDAMRPYPGDPTWESKERE